MKTIINLLGLALCIMSSLGASAQLLGMSDLELNQLTGKVREVKEYRVSEEKFLHVDTLAAYQHRGLKPPYYKRELVCVTTYNTDGYITSMKDFWGSLASSYDKTYYAPGKVLEQTFYNTDGTVRYRYTFTYDVNGNELNAVKKNDTEVIFTETFTHKPSERTTICEHTNVSGDKQTIVMKKRANGKVESFTFTQGDKVVRQQLFDEQGRLTEESRITRDGIVSSVLKHGDLTYTIEKYLTDDTGKKTLMGKDIVKQDSHKNPIERNTYDAAGNKKGYEQYIYKYDNQGNWIYLNKKSDSPYDNYITERVISYY